MLPSSSYFNYCSYRKVFLVGRRGPVQAACTAKELREVLGIPQSSTSLRLISMFLLEILLYPSLRMSSKWELFFILLSLTLVRVTRISIMLSTLYFLHAFVHVILLSCKKNSDTHEKGL